MQKQVLAGIIIVVALVAGGVGYMIGASGGVSGDAALLAKLEEVKKMFPAMPDSNFISGQVKSVDGKVVTLSTPPGNPFDESPSVREVTVTDSTKIVKNESKSAEVMQKEQEAYQKKMASFTPGSTDMPPTPPMPFKEVEIDVSDVKQGDQVSVEAVSQIRMLEKFEAVKITVTMSASMTTIPGAAPAGAPAPSVAPPVAPPGPNPTP